MGLYTKPNFMWSLLGKGGGDINLYRWSWSHGQDGHNAHISLYILYKFSLQSQKSHEFGMEHPGLMVYKIYIKDDHGLTLIYLTTRSNLVKNAFCAYTRHRFQVHIVLCSDFT